ncbi:hypothetical protein [Pseudomonas vancouverensis]|uniref:Uncharacterized protein n=1 Tax=Pseudomonas vancouverensis TaxID=95300 RepID=A0A1H2MWY0_PSEVA|nr:hypothetical protein [Pseudomonas vancouverensis]KAB0489630.1 hypothetical protein F7R09_28315 [Pseudomonas vancouverensis]TDB69276.1 hypothetical protein EIY72_00020 [Pseudomonas vancouverensis]SDU97604.1 hypothetical protein SAMN05216558_1379 [Pseudomonas vancouverensis]
MTFVLNILHKDFTLIASDRRGNAPESITMTVGNLSITTNGGGTIDGFKKTKLNKNNNVAVSAAGTTNEHLYLDQIKDLSDPSEVINIVRSCAENHFNFDARDELVNALPQMENQTIVSFFDEKTSSFFTTLHIYTKFSNYNTINVRRANPQPILLHLGTGSSSFENTIGIDEINSFIERVTNGANVDEILEWLDIAFEKVSLVAEGCSADYDAVISTRSNPYFVSLRSTETTTFKPHAF